MAYKRYSKRKYKKRYKKSKLNTIKDVADIAMKGYILARGVKKLLNVEKKNHDTTGTSLTISTTPHISQITNIPQGDTTVTRDGSEVRVKSLLFRYWGSINAAATRSLIRCLIVKDKQTNQAIYGASDLLKDITASDAINSPLNLDNKYRFEVLYDKVHSVSITGNQVFYGSVYLPLDQKIRFDGSAADITDLTSTSYSLFFVSTEAANSVNLNTFTRLRFLDN